MNTETHVHGEYAGRIVTTTYGFCKLFPDIRFIIVLVERFCVFP